ncbi:MAG: heparinase II/III family protein [Pseudomonadota bacterium]
MSDGALRFTAFWRGVVNARHRLANRYSARMARFANPPNAFLWQPEPRAVGSFARANQYAAGNLLFAGKLMQHRGSLWDLRPPTEAYEAELHGFAWLDDLAADGSARSREIAQAWLFDWIHRFGGGSGPGWQPNLAGRRLIGWISHTPFILKSVEPANSRIFFRALGRQTRYLARRWRAADPGLPSVEALTGLVYAGLALEGQEALLVHAVHDLGRECQRVLNEEGAILSRNPEELMEVFTLLVWAARTLEEAGKEPDPRHLRAMKSVAPTLRALRMGNGALARFHGGSVGEEGRLDQALADARIRAPARSDQVMGYVRLHAGPVVCVVDAGPPPRGTWAKTGHASTLGVEVSVGRRPLLGSVGPGRGFGPDWAETGRRTESHSTVIVERTSSSRFLGRGWSARRLGNRIVDGPRRVPVEQTNDLNGAWVLTAHDGYVPTHGLTHERRLFLSTAGDDLRCEDTLSSHDGAQKKLFDRTVAAAPRLGVRFSAVFHIHPDVEAQLALGRSAVALRLSNGEVWIFRQSGGTLELLDALHLDRSHLKPRPSKRIVVSTSVTSYRGQLNWGLKRAEPSGLAEGDSRTAVQRV